MGIAGRRFALPAMTDFLRGMTDIVKKSANYSAGSF
jgi:hypothetical protein